MVPLDAGGLSILVLQAVDGTRPCSFTLIFHLHYDLFCRFDLSMTAIQIHAGKYAFIGGC